MAAFIGYHRDKLTKLLLLPILHIYICFDTSWQRYYSWTQCAYKVVRIKVGSIIKEIEQPWKNYFSFSSQRREKEEPIRLGKEIESVLGVVHTHK